MRFVFTKNGFEVDGGALGYDQLFSLAFDDEPQDDNALRFLIAIAKSLIDGIRRNPDSELTRAAPAFDKERGIEILRELPYALGTEFVNINWIEDIYTRLANVFAAEIAQFNGSVEEYLRSRNNAMTVSGRVFFHLVETREESYPFAFMATYSAKRDNTVSHLPLKRALKEFDGDQTSLLELLATVSKAANESEFITELVESGELFSPLKFEPEEAYIFLREVPLYEDCGIICRIPDFWKRKTKSRLTLSFSTKEPAIMGMQSLVAFSPSIYFGDTELSREELEALLSEDNGLAFLKGKWVEVNQERIKQILAALDKVEGSGELTFAEAIKLQAGIANMTEQIDDTEVQVTNGEWLRSVFGKMIQPGDIEPVSVGGGFTGTLRHYQQTGLNWLAFMRNMSFGSLLADDMGLGKTVQILALLDKLREIEPEAKTLLVVPASLLVNWRKETERFAPNLRIRIIHGANQEFLLEDGDLFVTTYGMVARLETLAAVPWELIILDEAQAIKNPGIKQTKAVKELKSGVRIAMTGTPIENRLADLWSLFDFLNPGLLGTTKEFAAFIKKLRDSPEGYSKLRGAVSPFILRRLKTDKSVISDLPDKSEIKQYTTLSKKQVALYNALVQDLQSTLLDEQADNTAMERKGRILAAIIKFKQICNHPDQFNGQGSYDPKYSGKFETLSDICETIRDKRESVLVFTQFREMCEPLSRHLEALFGWKGLVIHGGVTPKNRGQIVEKFNTEYVPYMVLSLKAGGVGLNLAAANHVVHFDRWWNPAVENQATDRAFRIGQTKDVMVHKFITTGTIEEKIDEMIQSKQKLASDVIAASSGENWVTEMSNDELMNLFKLEV